MLNSNRSNAPLVVTAALLFAASAAFADTTVKSPATEARSDDNALRIEHGCKIHGGDSQPVIAQSVVFPTVSPLVTASDGSAVSGLAQVITQGSLAGLMKPLQDNSVFMSQQLKLDSLGNAVGFNTTDGTLDVQFDGRVPFQFSAPNFVASSCARRLLVQLAVADICAPAGPIQPGNVNLWIPANGSQYAALGSASRVEGIGLAPTLIVNRDLSANPLSPGCGAGIDVTVTPSAGDIDANLRIPGLWSTTPGGLPTDSASIVEYYNASLDHYFITWLPDEIAKLDDGTQIRGWVRTGRFLRTYKTAQAGTSPVCRYYIPPGLGDSHFFGRGTEECNATGQKNPSFILEDPAFMQMYLPAAGVCPAGTTQVYRVFSNRADANHRYMTDKATRDQMVQKGWLAEGDGPDLVVMCAPQ